MSKQKIIFKYLLYLWIFLISFQVFGFGIEETLKSSLIKAGDITFARLQTSIDDKLSKGTVTALIIDGKLKGTQLIGKVLGREGGKKVLMFNRINELNSKQTKAIKAYAIEWDDARVAIVTEADFTYLKKRGRKMAYRFLENNSNHKKIKLGAGSDFGILFMKDLV